MKKCIHFTDSCQAFYYGKNSVVRFNMLFFCKGYFKECKFYNKEIKKEMKNEKPVEA